MAKRVYGGWVAAVAVMAGLAGGLGPTGDAAACCMVPKSYAGRIGQSGQKALLIHHDGREELILGIDYRITPPKVEGVGPSETSAEAVKMPPNFVWVITVPSEPDKYAVAVLALFDDLSALTEDLLPRPRVAPGSVSGPAPTTSGVELGKRVQVGPYDIQPVRARGREALEGLNAWLGANGFPTEDADHMAYFVDRGFTFLCVKVTAPEGEAGVRSGGAIPPLHLSFKSERPYYPLKFSSRQGVFDVNLWVMTRGKTLKASDNAAAFEKLNGRLIVSTPVEEAKLPARVREVLGKASGPGAAGTAERKGEGGWNFALLRCEQVNKKVPISTWTEDVFLNVR